MSLLLIIALICSGFASSLHAQDKAAPAEAEKAKKPQELDRFVTRTKAIEDLVKGVININWALVALILMIALRKQLVGIVEALAAAMHERAFNVDVGTVKIQVMERVLDASEDRLIRFSISPFDLDEIPKVDQLSSFFDVAGNPVLDSTAAEGIPSQLTFVVSDYVGGQWADKHPAEKVALNQAYTAVTSAFAQAVQLSDVWKELVAFARANERNRFFEAGALADLLEKHPFAQDGLLALTPQNLQTDADDYLVLHVAGIACAQVSNWKLGKQLLDKIAHQKDKPHYLPAGDIWIACAYHQYIEESMAKDVEGKLNSYLQELLTTADKLLDQGKQFAKAMEDPANWRTIPSSAANIGYYKREIRKVLGSVAGIVADYAERPDLRSRYFNFAEKMLDEANKTIDNDPSSPLDRNNLADLYRQMGNCAEAHAQLNAALRESAQSPDPTFYNTLAWIFWKEENPLSGLLCLQQYGEMHAKAATDRQDVNQYMDNQILAAKLAAAIRPRLGPARFAQAADLLEAARCFFDTNWPTRKDPEATRIRAEMDELLGFTYLALAGSESRALEAFDRLQGRGNADAPTVVQWRRRLGHATALTRLARVDRRNYSAGEASEKREGASKVLADSAAALKAFSLDRKIPSSRRIRHVRIHLDTVAALHALAKETLHAGVGKAALTLAEQEESIMAGLQEVLNDDPAFRDSLGSTGSSILGQIQFSVAQRHFLVGQILVQLDPSFTDSDVLKKAESHFTAARGVNGEFDCQIDLSIGEMFLKAAQAGKDDPVVLYRRAVSSFEFAATREAPKLHGEAVRVLSDVYSIENSILRKKKPAKAT
jgi:hypothetical protein